MQNLHSQNEVEFCLKTSPSDLKGELGITQLPHLIFCSANDLIEQDPRFSGCDIDQNFFRLACRHIRKDSNGLFGCRTYLQEDNGLLKHNSWCCFKIKQVQKSLHSKYPARKINYDWQQPGIYISWNTDACVTLVLCIDAPAELRDTVQNAWAKGLAKAEDPYEWYCLIIEKITDLYDRSVWKLRDLVREDVEKRRSPESTDFEQLHEIARHIIHSNETLEVSLDTLDGIQQAYALFIDDIANHTGKKPEFSFRHTQIEISRLRRTIKASFLRSRSLSDRIHNEINLAYNLVNQRDSFMMKTIAVTTLVYLPGSYLASIFGMNFFTFSASSGLILSDKFWLYWVLTAIMTLMTVGTWMLWQSQSKRKIGTQGQDIDIQPPVSSRVFSWVRVQWCLLVGAKSESPV